MWGNVEEGVVTIGQDTLFYVSFGKGEKPFIIIPGLNDGQRTVKKTGRVLHFMYRELAKHYRVYVFSRKNELYTGMTTRDMARDQALVMEKLSLTGIVMGVSQGGMIAQWLAVDYPEKVTALILAITVARSNQVMEETIGSWIRMVEEERFEEFFLDMMEKTFTESYLRRIRPTYWFLKKTAKPHSVERFLIQARSCLSHDAYAHLQTISAPTLVIGGGVDAIIGDAWTQRELSSSIKKSELVLYPAFGHGVFAEAASFYARIEAFLQDYERLPGV